MNEEERRRSIEVKKYFIILPAFRGFYKKIDYSHENIISKELDKVYNSSIEEKLPREIERVLEKYDILNKSNYSENQRYWPGETDAINNRKMNIIILGGDGYLGWPTAMNLSQSRE